MTMAKSWVEVKGVPITVQHGEELEEALLTGLLFMNCSVVLLILGQGHLHSSSQAYSRLGPSILIINLANAPTNLPTGRSDGGIFLTKVSLFQMITSLGPLVSTQDNFLTSTFCLSFHPFSSGECAPVSQRN